MLTIKNRLCNLRFGGSNHHEHSYGEANFRNPPVSSFNLFNGLVLLLLISVGCTPAGPKALIQGENLVEKGKYIEAIQKLKLATTVTPTNAQAWNYLALAFHYSRQPDQAEKTYRPALLRLAELTAAEKTFQDALRLSPQNPEALNGLGCIRAHQRGRATEAAG